MKSQGLSQRPLLGQYLLTSGFITEDQLRVALQEQGNKHRLLGAILVDLGFLKPFDLQKALSLLTGYPAVDLDTLVLNASLVQRLPKEACLQNLCICIDETDQALSVAMADPEDILVVDQVRRWADGWGKSLHLCHGDPKAIHHALTLYHEREARPESGPQEIIHLAHDLIVQAVQAKASDIHIQPQAQSVTVAFRQDGLLEPVRLLHKDMWNPLVVRYKVMASLDIAESRRPQSGRFTLTVSGREVDFRLATHPTLDGENIVIRVLDKSRTLLPLEELGFEEDTMGVLKKLVQRPEGIILISGPTGSGKTTTLYGLLAHMNAQERNIMTLEDPVEYHFPAIRQTEIRRGGALTFSEGIRSLLRQDPDVIFVSEIRDSETAQMAFRAALTGHLVLSTLHAKDCASIPSRLLDLGVSPHLMVGNIAALMTQRLVRRLCETCKGEASCDTCQGKGFKGRFALSELIPFDGDMDQALMMDQCSVHLEAYARKKGIRSLWEHGMTAVAQGKTTRIEIERALGVPL